jgi:hypothetical protein
MGIDTFDNELDEYYNEDNNTCKWCENPIGANKYFCSAKCQKDYNNE